MGDRSIQVVAADRVLIGDGAVLAGAAVAVQGGRIVAVGTPAELRDAGLSTQPLRRFDGCSIVPGFIDPHVHLAFDADGDFTRDPATYDPSLVMSDIRQRCRKLLDAGVTVVRDLGSFGDVVGRVHEEIRQRRLPGPRVLSAGRPVTTPGGHLSGFGVEVRGAAQLSKAVTALCEQGSDVIKIVATGGAGTPGTQLGRAQFTTAELRVAVETAARHGRGVAAHAHGTEGIARAVAARVQTIEHCSWLDADGRPAPPDEGLLADLIRQGQVAVIAHPLDAELVRSLDRGTGPPPGSTLVEIWRAARRAAEVGLRLALGTDSMFGRFPRHDDLAWRARALVELADFAPAAVLDMLWTGGAAAVGLTHRIGRLQPGMDADVVVVDGNPLDDIRALSRVVSVWAQGRPSAAERETTGPRAVVAGVGFEPT